MKKLFLKYVTITDYNELKRYILSYPILLSAAIEEVVDKMISSDHDNELLGTTINKNIQLLKEVHRHGIYQVFPDEFPKELRELPAPAEKEMIFIPAGECTIGSDEGNVDKKEAPAFVANLEAFWIDKYPVTNREYARFILETGYPISFKKKRLSFSNTEDAEMLASWQEILGKVSRGFELSKANNAPDEPVVEISWFDAVEFARWAGKRLLTAEEWEKAARGSDGRNWSWGNEPDSRKGNVRESQIEKPATVTSYDKWPSPYGCYNMSGNVFEWTQTPAGESAYIMKGGCWAFGITEAQVWKREFNPPHDLWNALGFRCGRQLEQGQNREAAYTGFNEDDYVNLSWLLGMADNISKNTYTFERAKEALKDLIGEPVPGIEAAQSIYDSIQKYVLFVLGDTLTPTAELEVLAKIGHEVTGITGDAYLQAQSSYVLGKVYIANLDVFHGQRLLDDALAYYRDHPGYKKELALTLLARGIAHQVQNLSIGTKAVGAENARECLTEALVLLQQLGMKVEEQQAICALADNHRLLGDLNAAFKLAQAALSKTVDLSLATDEIKGMLGAGDVFNNIYAYGHAVYCFSIAYKKASDMANTQLLIQARMRLLITYSVNDKKKAAPFLAETLEAFALFESDKLQQVLNVVYNLANDKTSSWLISGMLGNLTVFADGGDCKLPFLPLAKGFIAYAWELPELVEETAQALNDLDVSDLSDVDRFYYRCLLTVANVAQDAQRAKMYIRNVLNDVPELGTNTFLLHAQMLYVEVCAKAAQWNEAIRMLEIIKPEVYRLGRNDLFITYLEYEAKLLFWAGNISAALEACDVASLEAFKLETADNLGYIGSLHLLRGRIFSAIGSPKDLWENEGAKGCFLGSISKLGSTEYMIRQAQTMLNVETYIRNGMPTSVAEMINVAAEALNGKTGGITDSRLLSELEYTAGLYYFRSGLMPEAMDRLNHAYFIAHELKYCDILVSSLQLMVQTAIEGGDSLQLYEPALEEVLQIVEVQDRPLEMLSIRTLAADFYHVKDEKDKAYETLQQAVTLYRQVRRTIVHNSILRQGWLKKCAVLFEKLICEVLLPQQKFREALLQLQEIKTASLQDLLLESGWVTAQELPPEQRAQGQSLWKEIRQLEIDLEHMADYVGDESVEYQKRVDLQAKQLSWKQLWGNNNKLEYNDSFSQQDLDELFQLLPSAHNTAVVEFYLTTKSILAFVLHGNGHIQDVIEIEMGEAELNGFVDLHFLQPCRQFFHHDTALHVDENWQQWITGLDTTLSELYILLFATPGKRGHSLAETLSDLGTKKLILVPYGILSLLPLQALYCEENGNRTYLLNEFESVVFTPCLAILKTVLQRPARNFNSLLAIQNPDGSLENADAEVAAISSLFAQTDVLAREQATKQNIIEKLSKAPVVHFACHGAFYMTDPMSSSLILADGELTLAEIYQVHLQPGALVVLSACETGLAGNTFINEYQGLPAGFIYAGAAAIVSSFWKVEDEPTMLLMQHLYRSLKQGSSPAAALREAQLHLRELTIGDTQPYAHPFYWAAFTVNGI